MILVICFIYWRLLLIVISLVVVLELRWYWYWWLVTVEFDGHTRVKNRFKWSMGRFIPETRWPDLSDNRSSPNPRSNLSTAFAINQTETTDTTEPHDVHANTIILTDTSVNFDNTNQMYFLDSLSPVPKNEWFTTLLDFRITTFSKHTHTHTHTHREREREDTQITSHQISNLTHQYYTTT